MSNLIAKIASLSNAELTFLATFASKDATEVSKVTFAHAMKELANRLDEADFTALCAGIVKAI